MIALQSRHSERNASPARTEEPLWHYCGFRYGILRLRLRFAQDDGKD